MRWRNSSITTRYTYDGNGNLSSRQTSNPSGPLSHSAYTFDADQRLIAVRQGRSSTDAAIVVRYAYDAQGQRIRKETASANRQ